MAAKCICPHVDDHNAIINDSRFLTLDQAAAVASGYRPCCAAWLKSKEFIRADPNMAEEVSLFHQELQQEVASGELESRVNRLNRTQRLIPRHALEQWLKEWKRRAGLVDEERKSTEPLLIQRAQAIQELIRKRDWNPKMITVAKKDSLRLELKMRRTDLYFTRDTFAKAWIEGGRRGWWSIKDKEKYTKGPRPQKEEHHKKS